MKVIGNGTFHYFDEKDEGNHAAGPEELWQESVVLYFWDPKSNVYSFTRLSQAPNKGTGQMITWLTVWTPDHIYNYCSDKLPLKPDSVTETTLTAGDGLCRYTFLGKGRHQWTIEDDDVSLDLIMQDDHQGVGFYPETAGFLVNQTARKHIEAIGSVTGRVAVKGKAYDVAGSGWRDRSWGPRDWQGWRAHRGFITLFEDKYIYALTFLGADGNLFKIANIIRNDTIEFIDDFEIVAYVGEDGVSNLGGHLDIGFDGKRHRLTFEPVSKGTTNMTQDFAITDTLCSVTLGDQTGVGFVETSHHAQGGTERPFIFPESHSILDNGIFPR